MSGCGCRVYERGTNYEIAYCALHSAAEEMLAQLKELRRTIDDNHWYADDLTAIIAKASEPGKE